MTTWSVLLVVLTVTSGGSVASESPYAELAGRPIKALSEEDVSGFLAGHGMGLALAAELNSFPGPKHVLELADEMGLDGEQRQGTQAAFDVMHVEAVRLGAELVAHERELDDLFRTGVVDEDRLRLLVGTLGRLRGELRFCHLRAHLAMRKLLTPKQIAAYDRARGYDRGAANEGVPVDCPHR